MTVPTKKKRHPTLDWNPAIVVLVLKYSPPDLKELLIDKVSDSKGHIPQNTPKTQATLTWAQKSVLSLDKQINT